MTETLITAAIAATGRRTIFFLFVILAVAAQSLAAAKADDALASIPYRIDYDGLLTIDVMVNGQGPYDFIIDTGSTITLAFARLANELAFAPTDGEPRRIIGITNTRSVPTYTIGDVNVGGVGLNQHIGIILDDFEPPRKTPHGILGLDFLREYAIHVDNNNRIMTIYPHGGVPHERTKGYKAVGMKARGYGAASGELFTVKSRINGKAATMIVDLGAAGTLINYEASRGLFAGIVARNDGDGFTTGSRLKDIFSDRTRARTARVSRIQIERKITWRRWPVWLYDAPIFDEIDVQHRPYGLFGVDLLKDRNFALDFGEATMMVGPAR